jgi:hypothetical protein
LKLAHIKTLCVAFTLTGLLACGESSTGNRAGASVAGTSPVAAGSVPGSGGATNPTTSGAPTMPAGGSSTSGGNGSSGGASGTSGSAAGPSPLGSGDHTPSSVTIRSVATIEGCLNEPWDLAFNPRRPSELWVPSHGDNGMCIVADATAATPESERRIEPGNSHFMPLPASMAFGGDETTFGILGTFATANDSQGDGNPLDGQLWNGITLWSSDLGIFGMFQGPDGNSHLDMLHDSPGARGIAWESGNIYWVFGAYLGDITRYDFVQDHERGNSDHSDGMQWHYAAGQVKALPGAPSHLAYDATDGSLYIADTGNGRLAKLDTKSGTMAPERHTRLRDRVETQLDAIMMNSALSDVVAPGGDLQAPAGLELHAGLFTFRIGTPGPSTPTHEKAPSSTGSIQEWAPRRWPASL